MTPERVVRIEPSRDQDAPAGDVRRLSGIRSGALTVLAVLAVVMVLKIAEAMIVPIVLSVLLSYALDPIVEFVVTEIQVLTAMAVSWWILDSR